MREKYIVIWQKVQNVPPDKQKLSIFEAVAVSVGSGQDVAVPKMERKCTDCDRKVKWQDGGQCGAVL